MSPQKVTTNNIRKTLSHTTAGTAAITATTPPTYSEKKKAIELLLQEKNIITRERLGPLFIIDFFCT
jgi:hypothetical protein